MKRCEGRRPRLERRSSWAAVAALLAALGPGSALQAQAAGGRLLGRVVDARTGEPLATAQVVVPELRRGTLSDAAGRYLLGGLQAGSYTVEVRSLGYALHRVSGVEVADGAIVKLDLGLEPEAVAVEGVTVSAQRERGSSSALLGDRRRAAVAVDALGAEQIARSADGDAASALRRVPGVSVVDGKFVHVRGLGERYGATTLNGAPLPSPLPDRKAVPLDLIPASMLERVVTSKSYSPDQAGDHAGGLVQLETRTFPATRLLRVSTGASYQGRTSLASGLGYAGGRRDWLGFDDGTRALPQGVTRSEPIRLPEEPGARAAFADALAGAWAPAAEEVPLNRSLGLAYGDRVELAGRTFGWLASASYSSTFSTIDDLRERYYALGLGPVLQVDYAGVSTTHSVALGGLLNAGLRLGNGDRITLSTVHNRLVDDEARELGGLFESQGPYIRAPRLRYLVNQLTSTQLRGEHRIPQLHDAVLEWRIGTSRAARLEPGTRTVVYRAGEDEGVYEFFAGPSSGLVFHQSLVDRGSGGAVDLKLPLPTARPVTLVLGASAELRDRGVYTRRFRLVPTARMTREELRLAPAELFTAQRIGVQLDVVEGTFAQDNYAAGQHLAAAYLMADTELLPGLRAVLGARVERARQALELVDLHGAAGATPAVEADHVDLLPALNLTYSLTENAALRLGLSRTVARPQFRELAPFLFADYYGGRVSRGNPHLVRGRIRSADLRWEWFFRPGAVLSASGFMKRFVDPIEPFAFLLGSSPARTWVNSERATLYGAELELRAPLLEGLELNANLTLARSRVASARVVIHDPDTGDRLEVATSAPEGRPMFGQSPLVINLGLTHRSRITGGSASLLFNRYGRRLDAFGGQDLPHIYEQGRNELDLVLEQPLGGGVELKLSASGLLRDPVELTQTFPNGETVTTRSQGAARKLSLSLAWEPGAR